MFSFHRLDGGWLVVVVEILADRPALEGILKEQNIIHNLKNVIFYHGQTVTLATILIKFLQAKTVPASSKTLSFRSSDRQ